MNVLHETIQGLQIGEAHSFKNLTVFPIFFEKPATLFDEPAGSTDYVTLDEALESGTATVTEVSESGSVPELQFFNEGESAVLLLDGEELVGAKQNRVLNLSILAPAQEKTIIPVSCVEQGRWAYHSDSFRSEDRVHYSRGRAAKAASVSMSMASNNSRRSDQREVWRNISEKSGRMRVSSATESMSDIYEQRKTTVQEFVSSFTHTENQVGAVFGIDGAVAGIDLFDRADIFSKFLPKLVRSYALDAVETVADEGKETGKTEVDRFLRILSSIETQEFEAVGIGTDIRLQGQMVAGGALENSRHLVHLGAFPLTSSGPRRPGGRGSRIQRASHRRRIH